MPGTSAQSALQICRGRGYQVSVVVVDRGANPQVIMRDDYAARFTMAIAEGNANVAVLAGIPTAEFQANRPDLAPVLDNLPGLLALGGGIPIRGGSLVGAIGISGEPGAHLDDACASAALEKIADRLEFAD